MLGLKNIQVPKNALIRKNFGYKNIWFKKIICVKKWVNNLGQIILGPKTCKVQTNFGSKKNLQKNLV